MFEVTHLSYYFIGVDLIGSWFGGGLISWEVDFVGVDLVGVDFVGVDLVGMNPFL